MPIRFAGLYSKVRFPAGMSFAAQIALRSYYIKKQPSQAAFATLK